MDPSIVAQIQQEAFARATLTSASPDSVDQQELWVSEQALTARIGAEADQRFVGAMPSEFPAAISRLVRLPIGTQLTGDAVPNAAVNPGNLLSDSAEARQQEATKIASITDDSWAPAWVEDLRQGRWQAAHYAISVEQSSIDWTLVYTDAGIAVLIPEDGESALTLQPTNTTTVWLRLIDVMALGTPL